MKTEIVIIGAGPAGLSASIYAARAKRSVIVLERAIPGGQQALTDKIDNYPGTGKNGASGSQLSQLMEEQAVAFGVKILNDNVVSVDFSSKIKKITTSFNGTIEAGTVIIASGRDPKMIGIPGEEEFRGRGVSYCAICDGAFFRDKDIAVIGGGNSALEEALYLTKFAKSVTLVHRRSEFRADKVVQDKIKAHEKINIKYDVAPVAIEGKSLMETLVVENVHTKQRESIPVSAAFIYIGSNPNTAVYAGAVVMNDIGYIITDENMKTSIKGVFAAGDVRAKSLYQVVTAVSDGAIAAVEADKYLEGE